MLVYRLLTHVILFAILYILSCSFLSLPFLYFFFTRLDVKPIKRRNQPSIPLLFSSVALTHTYSIREFVGITSSSSNRFNFHVIGIVCTFFFDTLFYKKKKQKRKESEFCLFLFLLRVYIHSHTYL